MAVNSQSNAKHAAVRPVNHSQRPITASGWILGAVIASGMHAVGGCNLPSSDATMIIADIVDTSNVCRPATAPTSEIGAAMAIPAA